VSGPGPRRAGAWLLGIALLAVVAVSPCEARKKNKREIPAASLPDWVQEAAASCD